MDVRNPRVVLCGLGYFERKLLEEIYSRWPVTVIESDPSKTDTLKDNFPELEVITADASSIITWKRINLAEIAFVVTTFRDSDISQEICRILRETLKSRIPVIVLLYDLEDEDKFEGLEASVIKPVDVAINIVLNKLNRNYSKAIDLGLKKGDIIELSILSKSHLTDRKLKTLQPKKWNIAAIYRNDELILPTPDAVLRVGDKVVFVGEPKVLENLANALLQGIPQFPLQYGQKIGVPLSVRYRSLLEETVYIDSHILSTGLSIYPVKRNLDSKLVEQVKRSVDSFSIAESISTPSDITDTEENDGCYVLPPLGGLAGHFYYKDLFKYTEKPFFISRGTFPYEGITVSLNCEDPGYTLETGMELSRLFGIKMSVVYIAFPKELRGREDNERLKRRDMMVEDFESIYKQKIEYIVKDGNPVIETSRLMKEYASNLLVIGINRNEPVSLFKPNAAFHILKRVKNSCLLIPMN
jgi:Trk K+ transport system NAD-binding subunit